MLLTELIEEAQKILLKHGDAQVLFTHHFEMVLLNEIDFEEQDWITSKEKFYIIK